MSSNIIDIHPHIISDDEKRYPPAPLFGKRSDWSQERPCTVDTLIAAMDAAGVAKAAVVHSSTTYGFDNSYVVDGCNKFPKRLAAVGSVEMTEANAPSTIRDWVAKGLVGVRIFTGGSTKDFDPAELEDPRAFPAWKTLEELKVPMCIQTGPVGLPQVTMLAKKFPGVNIILDHLGRPEVDDGPPYQKAQSLFALAPLANVYFKLTPRIFNDVTKGTASAASFFQAVLAAFGANRLAWGSNFPTSPGALSEILATAQKSLATVSESDREWIFGKTAQKLYPKLAN